ncbi:hypothetical protein ACX12M_17105 [Cellulosimicrobium cellulans]
MPQQSGPITGVNFTDGLWRDLFGDEPAIVGDVNGTAYQITTPTSTDQVLIGSPSQDSIARVGGFAHKIPAGQTEPLTVPPSTDSSVGRTDLIVCRYDPTWGAQEPGPVRLHRIAGVEGSNARPAYDGGPPGIEDLVHYAITRKQGQALNQAAVVDLRTRTGPSLLLTKDDELPTNVPLGTRARRGRGEFVRELAGSPGQPAWVSTGAGRLIAVYQFAFANLPPSGIPGRQETWQVWGASPQIVGSAAIPDPGVPYRVEAVVAGFFGNEADNNNTRWDFDAMVGATQISSWVGSNAFNQSNQWKEYHAAVSAQVFTGAQTFSLRTRRIYGTGYGAVARANRGGRVAIYEA